MMIYLLSILSVKLTLHIVAPNCYNITFPQTFSTVDWLKFNQQLAKLNRETVTQSDNLEQAAQVNGGVPIPGGVDVALV